jgi:glyoxylase-like metal-dependent hydrolase (beta-lactamase superfamily II)
VHDSGTILRVSTPMPGRPPQVNAYLAPLARGRWLLVDGGLGTDEAWAVLDAAVRGAAGGWRAVAVRVVTHMHMDHVGLAARSRDASGAPLLMHRLDAERMASAATDPDEEARYRASLLRRAGAPAEFRAALEALRGRAAALAPPETVDAVFDGEAGPVPGAPGWEFVWTPGHTAGHVSLFRAADAALVAGDAVLPRITPTLGVNRQREDPVGDYLAALDRIEACAPRRILPGHGDPLDGGVSRVRELREAALAESRAVGAVLDTRPRSVWEAVDARFPGREMPAATRMLALRETMAHLGRRVAAGEARSVLGDGDVALYRSAG